MTVDVAYANEREVDSRRSYGKISRGLNHVATDALKPNSATAEIQTNLIR